MSELHVDEVSIDPTLVRHLVDTQFPQFAGEILTPARHWGSSNALFRLGGDLVVRMPRQPGGGGTIDKEARWLPFVGSRLTIPVPTVLGVGEPDLGYSERWSVARWLAGTRASPPLPGPHIRTSRGLADDLARFVIEMRSMKVPPDAADDEALHGYRGLPLAALDADFRNASATCRAAGVALDIDKTLRVWDRSVEASLSAEPAPGWYHGDLVSENLLLNDMGRLAAVLDFGTLAIGNPTVDLIVAWEVLDEEGRRDFRRALDADDATWAASKGWALFIAMITFPYYGVTMPRRCTDRLAMAQAAIGNA